MLAGWWRAAWGDGQIRISLDKRRVRFFRNFTFIPLKLCSQGKRVKCVDWQSIFVNLDPRKVDQPGSFPSQENCFFLCVISNKSFLYPLFIKMTLNIYLLNHKIHTQMDQSSGLLESFLYWCHCFHKLRWSIPKCSHSMFSSQPFILQIASFQTESFLQTGYFTVNGPKNDTDLLIFLTFVFLSQTGTLWILMENLPTGRSALGSRTSVGSFSFLELTFSWCHFTLASPVEIWIGLSSPYWAKFFFFVCLFCCSYNLHDVIFHFSESTG